jgi:cytochrome c peroxidase
MNPFTLKRMQAVTLGSFMMLAAAGCGAELAPDEQPLVEEPQVEETWDAEQQATLASTVHGAFLFTKETFNGNGRTCSTCHTLATGGLTPAQVQAAWARNRNDPLFRAIDSDDGTGSSYNQLRTHASVVVDIALPANVRLASNPSARSVKLRRGVPSTLDAPRFDTAIMFDLREQTLQNQALHAIQGHAQARRNPTATELNSLVDFERNLFSSWAMFNYAKTGTAPAWPAGKTESEKRGKAWFEPTALCGSCHGGPLGNVANTNNPIGLPNGAQFGLALVPELNFMGRPVQEYIVTNPDGTETRVSTPDPGLMLTTGRASDANLFKMVPLRNLKGTAPYFHDNSAKDIAGIMRQYKALLEIVGFPHTDQDIADMTAYLKLL